MKILLATGGSEYNNGVDNVFIGKSLWANAEVRVIPPFAITNSDLQSFSAHTSHLTPHT